MRSTDEALALLDLLPSSAAREFVGERDREEIP
jgi:hypothetical protein